MQLNNIYIYISANNKIGEPLHCISILQIPRFNLVNNLSVDMESEFQTMAKSQYLLIKIDIHVDDITIHLQNIYFA